MEKPRDDWGFFMGNKLVPLFFFTNLFSIRGLQ